MRYSNNIKDKYKRRETIWGVTGVSKNKKTNGYTAKYTKNKCIILHKTYPTLNEAIVARLQAEFDIEGFSSKQAHLFEQYGITTKSDNIKEKYNLKFDID